MRHAGSATAPDGHRQAVRGPGWRPSSSAARPVGAGRHLCWLHFRLPPCTRGGPRTRGVCGAHVCEPLLPPCASRCCRRGLVVLRLLTGAPRGKAHGHILASQRVNPLIIETTFGWHLLQVVAQATEIKIPTEVHAAGRGVKGSCGSKMGDWSRRALHTPGETGPTSQMLGGP